MLTSLQIHNAIKQTRSLAEASRYLHCSYNTLKKYMKLYNIPLEPHKNQAGKGITTKIPKIYNMRLDEILSGAHNGKQVNRYRLRDMIIRECIKEERCEMCGFAEKRITDQKSPLQLAFEDGNVRNYSIENLVLVCHNCFFLFYGDKKVYYYDRVSGAVYDGQVNPKPRR